MLMDTIYKLHINTTQYRHNIEKNILVLRDKVPSLFDK